MLQGCYNSNPICKHPAFLNNGCVPYGKKKKIFSMKVFSITQKKRIDPSFSTKFYWCKRKLKSKIESYQCMVWYYHNIEHKEFEKVIYVCSNTVVFLSLLLNISIYNSAENANYADVNKRGWHFSRRYYGFRYETNDNIISKKSLLRT